MHCHILKHEDNGAMGWVNVARVNDQNEFVPANETDLTPTVPCILSGTGSACVDENNLPNDCTEVDSGDGDGAVPEEVTSVPNDPETEGPTQSPTKQPTSSPSSPPVVEESITNECDGVSPRKRCTKKTSCTWQAWGTGNHDGECVPDTSGSEAEASIKVDAEDPVKIMSSSSYRAGLKISTTLVGIFLALWN